MKSIFPNKERKSSTVQSIITDEGETITSKSTIVEKFNIFFTNTVSKLLESVQSTTILGLSDEMFTNEKCGDPTKNRPFFLQWRIQERGPGPPLFLDQNELLMNTTLVIDGKSLSVECFLETENAPWGQTTVWHHGRHHRIWAIYAMKLWSRQLKS